MGQLREKMVAEMEFRNLSPKTIKAYVSNVAAFSKYFGKAPDTLGEGEVRCFLEYLKNVKRVSFSNVNVAYCGLKFFYTQVVGRKWHIEKLPRPKTPKKLPIVLSRREVQAILNSISNLKHRCFVMTCYATGMRISETANLKLRDIDSDRMQVRVDQGKGNQDRYTILSEGLLKHLRYYWKLYRPSVFLFTGRDPNQPINVCTIQRIFKKAKKKLASASLLPSIA